MMPAPRSSVLARFRASPRSLIAELRQFPWLTQQCRAAGVWLVDTSEVREIKTCIEEFDEAIRQARQFPESEEAARNGADAIRLRSLLCGDGLVYEIDSPEDEILRIQSAPSLLAAAECGPFRSKVCDAPESVLVEWRPILRQATDIWIVDPYALHKSDEDSNFLTSRAAGGLGRFIREISETRKQRVNSNHWKVRLNLVFRPEDAIEDGEEQASAKFKEVCEKHGLTERFEFNPIPYLETKGLRLHDRFFVFRRGTTRTATWAFTTGRGLAALVGRNGAMTVAMLDHREIPRQWIPDA